MSKNVPILTQDRLKELLNYDPETGVFVWRRTGKAAGTVTEQRGATSYLRINIGGCIHYGHRLAWLYVYGIHPVGVIDHANRNGLDNSIRNLRLTSQVMNAGNAKIRRDNRSGFRGVSFCKQTQKWRAQLRFGKCSVNIGRFATKDEARAAYEQAAGDRFGDFLRRAG